MTPAGSSGPDKSPPVPIQGPIRQDQQHQSPLLSTESNAQHCSFATFADVKEWFVAVIKPDFSSSEAQRACQGSPQMRDTRRLTAEHNLPKNESSVRVSCVRRWLSPLQPGSVRSCSAALSATALGSGALALPYAFSLTGIGLGLVTMLLAVIASSLSLQILMIAARYTNQNSYADVLAMATKTRALSFALDLCIVLNGIGAITCILIFEGDFLPSVFASPPWLAQGLVVRREITVLGAAVLVYPLTWPADISALRYTSILVPIVLFATIVIVWTQVPDRLRSLQQEGGHLVWWDFDLKRWLTAVPLMVNAFTNQQNAVPSGNQLEKPSVARIVKATVNANIVIFLVLSALGIGGYVSWGAATQGDFIKNYDTTNSSIWVCRVMLSITVYFVIPVALLPASKSCAQLVLSALRCACCKESHPSSVLPDETYLFTVTTDDTYPPSCVQNEVVTVVQSNDGSPQPVQVKWSNGHTCWVKYADLSRPMKVSRPLHIFSSTLCLGICTAIAVATSDIASVINILGGLLATSVMFWFPALIHWSYLWPVMPRICRYFVLGIIIIFGVCGFASIVAMFFK